MALYDYRAIDSRGREIRLLKLMPSEVFASPLRGEILHTRLDDDGRQEYEALSYVWGAARFKSSIEVDGAAVEITPNLDLALRFLRRPAAARVLWVDALCINQGDVAERSEQVGFMREIYENCTRDIAWIGPWVDDTGDEVPAPKTGTTGSESAEPEAPVTAAQPAGRLDRWIVAGRCVRLGGRDAELGLQMLNRHRQAGAAASAAQSPWHHPERLSAAFVDPPLWSRVWIKQELACAPAVVLASGRTEVRWQAAVAFVGETPPANAFHRTSGHDIYDEGHFSASDAKALFDPFREVEHQRQLRQRQAVQPNGLLDVLARFKRARASDPRDKIYGLLGLVAAPHGVVVDYARSPAAVFTDTAAEIINLHGNLDIICQNPFPGWQDNAQGLRKGETTPAISRLPTWVPNFAHEPSMYESDADPEFANLLFAQRNIYAAGTAECRVPCEVVGGRLLRARGVVLGTMRHRSPEQQQINSHDKSLATQARQYREWADEFIGPTAGENNEDNDETSVLYRTREPVWQAFWRSLVVDCAAYPMERLPPSKIESVSMKRSEGKDAVDMAFAASSTVLRRLWGRWNFGMTENGLFVRHRQAIRQGDLVVVLDGGKVPLVLRWAATSECFVVVSTAYVHGFMDGEAEAEVRDGRMEKKDFLLG